MASHDSTEEQFMTLMLAVGPSPCPHPFYENTPEYVRSEWHAWARRARDWWEAAYGYNRGLSLSVFEEWQRREEYECASAQRQLLSRGQP